MEPENLASFARWFLEQSFARLRPPRDAVRHYVTDGGSLTSLVLHRCAPYQAELFVALPSEHGGSFPEHRHPCVDSIEYFLSGEIAFTVRGRRVQPDEKIRELSPDGASSLCGLIMRIRPTDYHGGVLGPTGGSFLSLQRWRDGVHPTSVGLDWEGTPHVSVSSAPASHER